MLGQRGLVNRVCARYAHNPISEKHMNSRKQQSFNSYILSEANRIRRDAQNFITDKSTAAGLRQTGKSLTAYAQILYRQQHLINPLAFVQLPNKKVKNARTSVHSQPR